jgi:hypothetical protein
MIAYDIFFFNYVTHVHILQIRIYGLVLLLIYVSWLFLIIYEQNYKTIFL